MAERSARQDEHATEVDAPVIPATLRRDDAETIAAPPSSPPESGRISGVHSTGGGRYRVERELGRGGMGVVLLAEDLRLGRAIAIKRHRRQPDERATLRFVEEARATAQLEHPSIVPLYDVDHDEAGEPFFTMRYVSGRSLRETLDVTRKGDSSDPDVPSLAELLVVFLKICDAVAYAHARGVVHRDLKPENVMLGRFGEVFVMDWGVARVRGTTDDGHQAGDVHAVDRSVTSVRDSAGGLTVEGSIVGTPGYMAPEQARGLRSAIDERVDVFALGAMLYELLTLEPAFDGQTATARLVATLTERPMPPRQRAPHRAIPADLDEPVMRALDPDPARRIQTVLALRAEIAAALEGSREATRRREASEARRAEAGRALEEHHARLAHARELARALAGKRAALSAVAEAEARRALWRDEEEVARAEERAEADFFRAYGALVAAIQVDPTHDRARDELVRVLIERARRLTLDGDAASAASLLQIARQHDPDRAATLLDASADVRIECVPSGASLALLAQERQGPIVVERPLARGIAPLARALPPGSYVAEASRDGHATVRLPFVVAPGRALSFSIALPPASAVPEGFCVVPGGAWIVGGDRSAPGAEPRREVVLPPFAISARVVTMGEYAEFLSALDPEEARRRVPRVGGVPLAQAGEDGRYAPPWIDPDGDLVRADDPACGVSALDADAYAAWRARRTGLPLRLPTSDEWEVAARGADERAYPWGHGWDPTLSWNIVSRGRLRGLHTVGSRPLDRSPFGVLDAGGLVRNWTSTRTPSGGRLVRGGAFQAAADQCRIGRVTDAPEDSAYITFGLRLCLSWSA